ncbi:MAG: LysM peptidoglycan-binding domain-containing protein [Lachnospiraceae bacterium]|nr:LysM peptidoglycan-binding domain-containing protein [Lachnospiraceae bacterium]
MKKKKTALIRSFILAAVVFAIIFGGIVVGRDVASASGPEKSKYFTSITIEEGDSLWSIARQYCDSDTSLSTYIDEIKSMNGIVNDRSLVAGHSLMIYYMR